MAIDATVGAGLPGVVLVTGSSDKGDRKNRAAGRVPADSFFSLPVKKEAEGEIYVDIWYGASDRFDVSITTPRGSFGPYKAPKTGKSEYEREFQYYHLSSSRNAVRTLGGKRQIRVDLIGEPGVYVIQLHGAQVESGHFDAFIGPNPENPMEEPFNAFAKHVRPGSLWDGATAKGAICVGCHVLRAEWKNIQNRTLAQMGEGKRGEIWLGSGTGPTADGREGVTLTAPGDRIVTAYARDAEWAQSLQNVVADDGAMYGLGGGTSAAAALVAGVAALLLELDPTLDAAQVKQLLQETGRSEEQMGDMPNATWGHGKIDAYAALARVAAAKAEKAPKKKKGKKKRR